MKQEVTEVFGELGSKRIVSRLESLGVSTSTAVAAIERCSKKILGGKNVPPFERFRYVLNVARDAELKEYDPVAKMREKVDVEISNEWEELLAQADYVNDCLDKSKAEIINHRIEKWTAIFGMVVFAVLMLMEKI